MARDDPLKEYMEKRDFSRTPEPEGGSAGEEGSGGSRDSPIFVVHKHDASNLHYDFRLEVEGALKSWAVPKGPSTDPSEKRLALPTEDHPLEYAGFEGVIPEDEYGGGTVLVWDAGPYENLKTDDDGNPVPLSDQVSQGHLTVWLQGEKITGGYALTRTGDERWILVKMDDDQADARRNPVSTEPDSVLTGRSLEDVEKEADKGKDG